MSSSTSPPGPSRAPSGHSRNTSTASQHLAQDHRPSVPSGLRQAELPPATPDTPFQEQPWREESERVESPQLPAVEDDGMHPQVHDFASIDNRLSEAEAEGETERPTSPPDAQTRLLQSEQKYHLPHNCGSYNCNHGTFSPRPGHLREYGSFASTVDGGATPVDDDARSMASFNPQADEDSS